MNDITDMCFLCTKKECVPVDDKIVSQVEYVLPEVTIFKLGIPLRICSVCDGALYSFYKFKQYSVQCTRRLEASIKGAQGPLLPTDSPHLVDSQPYNSEHKKLQHGSPTEQQMAQPSLHTDRTSTVEVFIKDENMDENHQDQQSYNTAQNNSELEYTKNNSEEPVFSCNNYKQSNEKSSQEMADLDPDNNTNPEKIEEIFIKEEQLDESSSDIELFTSTLQEYTNSSENNNIDGSTQPTTEKQNHVCAFCQKPFSYKSELHRHMKMHTGVKDFECNICNKTFAAKYNLIRHLKNHPDETDLQCKVCNKLFTRKFHLESHMKTHVGIKDLKCNLCDKSFFQKSELNKHMQIHDGVMYLDYNNEDPNDSTPSELCDEPKNNSLESLPDKSRVRYERTYQVFVNWCDEKNVYEYTETVLMDYFKELVSQNKKSLWSIYSMLKSCIMIHNNTDISKYTKITAYLKIVTVNYKPKIVKVLEEEHINSFIDEAPNDEYLMMKIVLIIGLSGALPREKLYNILIKDVEVKNDIVIITIPATKNNTRRQFAIINIKWVYLIQKYIKLRSLVASNNDHFFVLYQKGRCINSPVGLKAIGSIPSKIANFLNLEDYREYTGHCFRRSSASLLSNPGDLLNFRKYGGQKRSTVTENYDKNSVKRKMNESQMSTDPGPSTSKIPNTTSTEIKIEDITDY